MPYIDQKYRPVFDSDINTIVTSLRQYPDVDRDGMLNYIITRIVLSGLKPETGWRYFSLERVKAIFNEAKDEMGRRLMAPYEDKAIERNGDLEEYKNLGTKL